MIFKTIFAPLAFEETANLVTDTPMEFYPTSGAATVLAMEGHDEAAIVFARTMRAQFEERCDAGDVHIVPVSEALKQNGVTASWTEETGQLPVSYSMAARVADLVVMAIPAAKEVYPERELFESLLMQSSAPVFLTPRSGLAAMPRRPLVAWDGSLQASRVVRCALPMLQESEETTLLTIGETDVGTPSLEAAKLWLERAGVRVKTRSVEWPDRPIAERILNQCDATNSDLVLMGGYSHSRLRETIMGGVTLHMIRHADRPLLMVH